MRFNSEMEKMLRRVGRTSLVGELADIARSGFVELDGCFFLANLDSFQRNASLKNFPDRTGYECFVNSIHIDDYVKTEFLACALSYLSSVFETWNKSGLPGVLQGAISGDKFDATVKFHLQRPGETWLSDDLEGYEQALFTVDSSDEAFLERYGR
ncbi:hypothetical protein DLD99_16235 [Pseudomonas kribbensis]|uniref:Uncharacterized protein n=1 Tax=Pseudomonas kribbensis TaxID=1628086 RepID=A0A345RRP0_9PSED|nr:hypothetical protein [Pseudomonas kribbensis]AXI61956.1 hypothetical protein DLD99_16235 [Pseudomonas kribbensis]